MPILNAEAIGLLRHQIIEALGFEEARKLLLRFGFQSGYTDCLPMEIGYECESPMEPLAVAPRIHTYEGIVAAEATTVEMDLDADTLLVEGNWYSTTTSTNGRGSWARWSSPGGRTCRAPRLRRPMTPRRTSR